MNTKKKKSIKSLPFRVIGIFVIIVVVIITALMLLLSIFFPNELVRQKIEEEGSKYVGVEVKLEGLQFNIFKGLELTGFTVRQYGLGWKDKYIVSLKALRLKYRILPLLQKTVSVRALVIEEGTLNLEKNWKGSNWDYFLTKFGGTSSSNILQPMPIVFISKDKEKGFSSEQIPLEIDIKKIGVDGLNVNYKDSIYLDVPCSIQINDLKFMARNISVKKNKPVKITAGIKVGVIAGKYLDLGTELKAVGQLKIFDDKTKKISVTGPIELKVKEGSFSSNKIKALTVTFIENFLGEILGPTIKLALQDPTLITGTADKYFSNTLKDSDAKIKKTIKDAEAILEKKEEVAKYGENLVTDFELSVLKGTKDIDSKINTIDKKISPIIDTASKIPMVESLVNLSSYRNKVKDLKKEANKRKKSAVSKYKSNLENSINSKIDNYFPKKIPDYNDFKRKFDSRVDKYKREININIKKLSTESFIKNFLPDLGFMNKEWKINNLSTVYEIGKKESKAKELNLSTEYFDLNGEMLIKGKYINFDGSMSSGVKDFNLDFLPTDKINSKVKIKGELPKLTVKLNEKPQLEIDAQKQKDMAVTVVENYIKNNYGSNKIISNIMRGFSIKDVNIEEVKKMMSNDKTTQLNGFNKKKKEINSYIEKKINKIIKDLKSNVPGL